MCTHTPRPQCGGVPPMRNLDPEPKPRSPQVGVVQLDALTNLFGANCQWETSARTASDKTGCWGEQIPLHEGGGQWGRMCWCAAGGWGGTMDGLVSPLADWFEMAPLSLSPWGVPLSCFWFPLLTNSKQKSISFSRRGGGGYRTVFQMGKVIEKYLFARDGWLSHSPSTSFFPSSLHSYFSSAASTAQWSCSIVGCWVTFFHTQVGLWGTCWRLRNSFAAGVINIKIYRDAITGWFEIGLMSPLGSLSGQTSAFSHSWRAFFSFSVFFVSFSLPEKTR